MLERQQQMIPKHDTEKEITKAEKEIEIKTTKRRNQ